MFYLSAYLEEHRDEYIERLRELGRGSDTWNNWIAFFLRALKEQSHINTNKARAMMDLYERMKSRVIALTHSQYAVPLLDQIFEKPFFRSTQISLTGDPPPSRQAISNLLRTLRDNDILTVIHEGRGRRPQTLAFLELINLCEVGDIL